MPRPLAAALFCAGLALPAHAQEASPPAAGTPEAQTQPEAPRPIRNAPNPRALEFTAYIFAASNVCGYRIGVPEFEELLAKQNVKPADVSARGAFGARVQTMFALMSNQMQLNRETACLAVAGEYGPEGTIAKNVLQPAGAAPEPAPAR